MNATAIVRLALRLFALLTLSASPIVDMPWAGAPVPDQRAVAIENSSPDFDWTRFAGVYRFGECIHSPEPIWADIPGRTHVDISAIRDYTVNPTRLALSLVRKSDEWHPIGLGWSLEDINAGPREDARGRTWESQTTSNGISGTLKWLNPYGVGFATLRLTMDASGDVEYEMSQKSESDRTVRRERCALTRQSDIRHSPLGRAEGRLGTTWQLRSEEWR